MVSDCDTIASLLVFPSLAIIVSFVEILAVFSPQKQWFLTKTTMFANQVADLVCFASGKSSSALSLNWGRKPLQFDASICGNKSPINRTRFLISLFWTKQQVLVWKYLFDTLPHEWRQILGSTSRLVQNSFQLWIEGVLSPSVNFRLPIGISNSFCQNVFSCVPISMKMNSAATLMSPGAKCFLDSIAAARTVLRGIIRSYSTKGNAINFGKVFKPLDFLLLFREQGTGKREQKEELRLKASQTICFWLLQEVYSTNIDQLASEIDLARWWFLSRFLIFKSS